MKSEVYVVNLVRASIDARLAVADLLDRRMVPDRGLLLLRLPREEALEALAGGLRCHKSQVFERLGTRIRGAVRGRLPPILTLVHLHQLMQPEKRQHLATILGCQPGSVVGCLFDAHAMLDTLFGVDPTEALAQLMARPSLNSAFPPPSVVLWKILERAEEIMEAYGIGEFEWGNLLSEDHWLQNDAVSQLRGFAAEQGFANDTDVNLLAAAIETQRFGASYEEVRFDILAIINVQQRIMWIVRQLREQAQDLLDRMEGIIPAQSSLSGLRRHIEFYEIGAPARAWRMFFGSDRTESDGSGHTIQEGISDISFCSTGVSGTPTQDAPLGVRTEEIVAEPPWWQMWNRPQVVGKRIVVSADIVEQRMPVDILICDQVPEARADSLEKLFTSLLGRHVAQDRVPDLGAQLLRVPYTPVSSLQGAIIGACRRFLPELIQSLILAGIDLPSELTDSVWSKNLSWQLPIVPVDYGRDALFPKGRDEIVDLLKQTYQQCRSPEAVE